MFIRTFYNWLRARFGGSPSQHPPERIVPRAIEPLESRIAPATLVSPTTVTFTDHDGDLVTIKSSRPIFTSAVVADLILKFDTGDVVSHDNTVKQQLQLVDLTKATSTLVTNSNLSITAQTAGGGDGLVDVGRINALNVPLGAVSIDGDLGRFAAGIVTKAVGLKSLTVESIGGRGILTQQSGGTLDSSVNGQLGALTVKGDFVGAFLKTSNTIEGLASIGSINIGGSLKTGASDSTGLITSGGNIGPIHIGGDILGGALTNTGAIRSSGKIVSVTVLGSILGGAGTGSGTVVSGTTATFNGDMGFVKIGHDLHGGGGPASGQINSGGKIASVAIGTSADGGSLLGGIGPRSGAIISDNSIGVVAVKLNISGSTDPSAADHSGEILSGNNLGAVTVGGSITGGTSSYSGFISAAGAIGMVHVVDDITGGAKLDSGAIVSGAKIAGVSVGHSLTGGAGLNSGFVFSGGNLGPVKIGANVTGGAGGNSGEIGSAGNIGTVNVVKAITGAGGESSGSILSGGTIASVKVGTYLKGSTGPNSGQISSGTSMGAITIAGSLIGGDGPGSGAILSHTLLSEDADIQGNIGAVRIMGGIFGGPGPNSGVINSAGTLASVFVGESVTGGAGDVSGAILSGTDYIGSGAMGMVNIGTDLQGGSVSGSASLHGSGFIQGQRIAGVSVGGSIKAGTLGGNGTLDKSGSIRADDSIGPIYVGQNLEGNSSNAVVISARGQTAQTATDIAVKSLTVKGSVQFANILAGYDTDLSAVNPDAQIGPVNIGATWHASNLVAGVQNASSGNVSFGDLNDQEIAGANNTAIISRIASVVIGGAVSGGGSSVHFGFVTQQVGSLKINGAALLLNPGAANDFIDPLPGTPGISLHEVAVS